MTLHVNIDEPQVLIELVEAARRGEAVLLERDGVPQARIVPIHVMSRQEKEEIAARRVVNIGIMADKYRHLHGTDALTVPPSMTDEEIEERFQRKFGAPYPSDD